MSSNSSKHYRFIRVCPVEQKFVSKRRAAELPLPGQIFGLPPHHISLMRNKLTDEELRNYVNYYNLWRYTPPWQVPRTCDVYCKDCCHLDVDRKEIVSTKELIRAARKIRCSRDSVDKMKKLRKRCTKRCDNRLSSKVKRKEISETLSSDVKPKKIPLCPTLRSYRQR